MVDQMTAAEFLGSANKSGKYNNVKTEVDGFTFDSKAEAKRFGELKLLLDAGKIHRLTLQPKYALVVNGVKICTYVADFTYQEQAYGGWTVEDVKGAKTAVYRLKKKLMKACLGIDVVEVAV